MLVPKDGKMNGKKKKKTLPGTSLVVQRLRLHPSTAAGAGSILVRELRSHMPLCSQKKKQGKKKHTPRQECYLFINYLDFMATGTTGVQGRHLPSPASVRCQLPFLSASQCHGLGLSKELSLGAL